MTRRIFFENMSLNANEKLLGEKEHLASFGPQISYDGDHAVTGFRRVPRGTGDKPEPVFPLHLKKGLGFWPELPKNRSCGFPCWPMNGSCDCRDCYTNKSILNMGKAENPGLGKRCESTVNEETPCCGATNGLRTSTQTEFLAGDKLVCWYSGKQNNDIFGPWIYVDLESVYTFSKFRIYLPKNEVGRMTTNLIDVFLDSAYGGLIRKIRGLYPYTEYTLSYANSGRYLLLIKATWKDGPLAICELVFTVCKPGTWSGRSDPNTCKPCPPPEDHDYACDNYFGPIDRIYHIAIMKPAKKGPDDSGNTADKGGSTVVNVFSPNDNSQNCMRMETRSRTQVLWWRVDLQGLFAVYELLTDALVASDAAVYFKNFKIVVTYRDEFPADPTSDQLCLEVADYQKKPHEDRKTFKCTNPPVYGCFFWITAKDKLGLCKVRVFGHPVYLLKAGQKCRKTSQWLHCEGGYCVDGLCRSEVLGTCHSDQDCLGDLVCDFGKCKVDLDQPCERSEQCKRGTFCDSSIHKCRIQYGKSCKDHKKLCAADKNAICDNLNICALKLESPCTQASICQSGASCKAAKCQCLDFTEPDENNHCKPIKSLIGEGCGGNENCVAGTCKNGKCACEATQEEYYKDYSCRQKVGTGCDENDATRKCMEELLCETVCKLPLGENCKGHEGQCKSGLVCDPIVCKMDLNQDCTSNPDMCKSGTVCIDGRCKIVLGGDCKKHPTLCDSGFCSDRDNHTCRLDVEMPCTSETAGFCRNGSVCEDGTCKLKFKEVCSGPTQCRKHLLCSEKGGPNDKKCRRPLGHACDADDDCAGDSICDNQKHCRLPKGGQCDGQSDQCLSGAQCTEGGTCQCIPSLTKPSSQKCGTNDGIIGGGCEQNHTCHLDTAFCNADNKCQCRHSYVAELSTLTCLSAPGSSCSSNKCMSGLICDVGNICTIKSNGSCAEKRAACSLGTICDSDDKCRCKAHESCAGNDSCVCRIGTACDVLKLCKYVRGELCRKDTDCVAGSLCDSTSRCQCREGVSRLQNKQCVPEDGIVGGACEASEKCRDPNAVCNDGRCQCKQGYAGNPIKLTCGKAVGEPCAENPKTDVSCIIGLICDPVDKVCQVDVGQKCQEEKQSHCMNGSVCDYDSVCRLDLLGDCSGNNSIHCRTGLYCDWMKSCTKAVGDSCNGTEGGCVAGANCVKSKCVCDPAVATKYGNLLCAPRAGRYGSDCEVGLGCTMKTAKCVEGVCRCIDGFLPTRHFSCVSNMPMVGQIKTAMIFGITLAVFIGLLVLALVIWSSSRREQNKKREEIVAGRTHSMRELKQLDRAVHRLVVPEAESSAVSISQVTASEGTESAANTASEMSDVSSVMTNSEAASEMSGLDTASQYTSDMSSVVMTNSEAASTVVAAS